jgi:hypothetical protein
MYARRTIERKVELKKQEISEYEAKIAEAKAFVAGLEEALKALPKDANSTSVRLRPGTNLAKAYAVLKGSGSPMRINKLMKAMGLEETKENRVSLSGSIGAYVRKSNIFTRPGPNTFGLVEFGDSQSNSDEPPEGFGEDESDVAGKSNDQ